MSGYPYGTKEAWDHLGMMKLLTDQQVEDTYLRLRKELGYDDPHHYPEKGDMADEHKTKQALYDLICDEYHKRRQVNPDLLTDMLWAQVVQEGDRGESGRP